MDKFKAILDKAIIILNMEEIFPFRIVLSWPLIAAFFTYITLKLSKNYFLALLIHQFFVFCCIFKMFNIYYKEIDMMFLIVGGAIWLANMMAYGLVAFNTKVEKKYRY